MKNLHIENSYNIWTPKKMRNRILYKSLKEYETANPEILLNRSYESMYAEWILHNIGYYITKPFCKFEFAANINLRCRDVDLEEKVYKV